MNSRCPGAEEFLALPGCVFDAELSHRFIIIAKLLESLHHLRRDLGAAKGCEALDLGGAQDRQHARAQRHLDIELLLQKIAELKIIGVVEEELREHEIGPVIDFVFEMAPIDVLAGFAGNVALREAGRADGETPGLANEANQFVGVFEAALDFLKLPCPDRRITTQRQNVFDAESPRFFEDIRKLLFGRVHACQMRHCGQAVLPLDAIDDHERLVARAATGAIRDRAEVRFQRHQGGQRSFKQSAVAFLRFRGKELEGDYGEIALFARGKNITDELHACLRHFSCTAIE